MFLCLQRKSTPTPVWLFLKRPDGIYDARAFGGGWGETMKRVCLVGLVSVALVPCLATAALAAEPGGSLRGAFHGEVTVSEAGAIDIDRIEGVSGALEQVIRAKLAEARWVPGVRHGKPVTATVPVTGSVLLAAVEGGEYAVRDLQVRVEPKLVTGPPLQWRTPLLREGVATHVELRLHVDNAGSVTAVETVSSSSPSFERDVRKTLDKWRFARLPEGLATMTVTLPVWFHAGANAPAKPDFVCDRDPGLPALADQDGCLDLVELTAIRR